MKPLIVGFSVAFAVAVVVSASACSQPPIACTVPNFTGFAAKYALVDAAGAGDCGERAGDVIGMSSYNPPKQGEYGIVPNLDVVSLAIRTESLGALVALADSEGITDVQEGHAPHALGNFVNGFPIDDICTATLSDAQQQLLEVPEDLGDPEDPDDDLAAQDAVDVRESWSDVQIFVNAANLGTQARARYTVTDGDCTASYDVLAVFPAVICEDIVADPDRGEVLIASIDDDGPGRAVRVTTSAPHGLEGGELIEIAGVDDDDGLVTYDGEYSVAAKIDDFTFVTAELDPLNEDDPDDGDVAVVGAGAVQALASVANESYCSPVALPAEGIPVGSGISPDFPVVCDPVLLMCVLAADPSDAAAFPVLK